MQNNNPQIYSYDAALYQYNNVLPGILNRDRIWEKALLLPDRINLGTSHGFNSKDGIFKRMIRPRQNPQQQIAAISPSTGTSQVMTLTWADPTYQVFRIGDVMKDLTTFTEGTVISVAPGTVQIEAVMNPTIFDCTLNFQVGSVASFAYDQSIIYGSGGKTEMFYEETTQTDYLTTINDTVVITRKEGFDSFVGQDGAIYVASQRVRDMLQRINTQIAYDRWFGEGGIKNTSRGKVSSTFGIRNAIINPNGDARESGLYRPITSMPQLSDLTAMANYMTEVTGRTNEEFLFVIGLPALESIQLDPNVKNLVIYPGTANTVGGVDVKGLDVMQYAIGGMRYYFMIAPFLSDAKRVPAWFKWSIYGIDMSSIPTINPDGSEGVQTPLMKIHFESTLGENPTGELLLSNIPGKSGMPGSVKEFAGSMWRTASKNIDGLTVNAQYDGGMSILAGAMALTEWPTGA